MELDLAGHRTLIQSILQGKLAGIEGSHFELIETHISSVIISDRYVYKFKKPLDLGFLDFSTLQKRHFYCDEELRLNRRLSPDLYVDVVAVYGSADAPSLEAQGEVLEYLVRMKPFPQQAQLDRLLQQGRLQDEQMVRFAEFIADFHGTAAIASDAQDFGNPEQVMKPVVENFQQIRQHQLRVGMESRLIRLQQWSEDFMQRHRALFEQRKQQGFIRECHGDLHLRNLAWLHDAPLAFDCIEFDPNLYWIDVINDIAFLLMDLYYQQRAEMAQVFLNRYLEQSGDYSGLRLLRFYLLYRALVRVKIEIISATQAGVGERARQQAWSHLEAYLQLAESLIEPPPPTLYILHGPSASGKSTLARQLAPFTAAVILRSDVERKRLFGVGLKSNMGSGFGEGIYTAQATEQTYHRLLELSEAVLDGGFSVMIDATFSQPAQRAMFQQMAKRRGCDYRIIDLHVPASILRQRIVARQHDVSDADLKILENQLIAWQPLEPRERDYEINVDATREWDRDSLRELLLSSSRLR